MGVWMYKYAVILIFIISLLLIRIETTMAANTFNCRSKFVSLGETQLEVKRKCGEPTSRNRYDTMWIYDFGPSYFVIYVKFANGKVNRIKTGGYGGD